MLTSLLAAGNQQDFRSCHIELNWGDSQDAGTFLSGTNFNLNGNTGYPNTDGSNLNYQCVLSNYTSGNPLTLRMLLSCTVNTGTKTWTAKLAAMSPGDAQSVLTKTFGTGVVSAATAPNSTARGLYEVLFVFDTAAKLDNAADGDLLEISITQTAHTGTSGTATPIGLELYG